MTTAQVGEFPTSPCKSCGADVIWAIAERSLKPMPVDPKPVGDGNILLIARADRPPVARVLKVADRFGKGGLRAAHFVNCPFADQHRRPRTKGRRPAA